VSSAPLGAVILLGLAALGGTGLLTLRLRGGNPPLAFAFVHGLIAASGMVVLIVGMFLSPEPLRWMSFASFVTLVFGASLGIWMNRRHRKGVLIPIGLVFLHLLFVVSGYLFLLASRYWQ
jgi:hypothetical protein